MRDDLRDDVVAALGDTDAVPVVDETGDGHQHHARTHHYQRQQAATHHRSDL